MIQRPSLHAEQLIEACGIRMRMQQQQQQGRTSFWMHKLAWGDGGGGGGEEAIAGYGSWKGGRVYKSKQGGRTSTYAIYAAQVFEAFAFSSISGNLVSYVANAMHFSPATSSTITSNFLGSSFLLALVGGFISDTYIPRFWAIMIGLFLELLGSLLLAMHAHFKRFQQSTCNSGNQDCEKAHGIQVIFFFIAIYVIALGSGALRATIVSHGGDQFDEADFKERRHMSSFFNWFFFFSSGGTILGLIFGVWVQENVGYKWGYGLSSTMLLVSLICMAIGAPMFRVRKPQGSPLTRLAQVFVAAYHKRRVELPNESPLLHELSESDTKKRGYMRLRHTEHFKFLDKAAVEDRSSVAGLINDESLWYLCPITQVEEAKLILRLLPIFACNIIPGCILAQLQTLVVQEAATTDRHIFKDLVLPEASMTSIPFMVLLALIPFYDYVFFPFVQNRISFLPLRRVGIGLIFSIFVPILAALFEIKRRNYHKQHPSPQPPISFLWITPVYLSFSLVQLFLSIGLLDFFYTQSPSSMHSLSIALSFASMSFGYFISSLLIELVDKVTTRKWFGYDLDSPENHLDYFHWFLSGISILNFFIFLYCAHWYKYKQFDLLLSSTSSPASIDVPSTRINMVYHSRSSSEITNTFQGEESTTPPNII